MPGREGSCRWVSGLIALAVCVLTECQGEDDGAATTSHDHGDRPRLREFAFSSRPQDRLHDSASGSCPGGEQAAWRERGAEMLADGDARGALRCLILAARLGCRPASVYQDMSMARLALGDLSGALQDARRAALMTGCRHAPPNNHSDPAELVEHCSPELLLNVASLLDKVQPAHQTLPRILALLRRYLALACDDAGSALTCTARGAIPAVVELWRLGQLTLLNWDTWHRDLHLLAAAVAADVDRCSEQGARSGARFSVVGPWEASMFPLPATTVAAVVFLLC